MIATIVENTYIGMIVSRNITWNNRRIKPKITSVFYYLCDHAEHHPLDETTPVDMMLHFPHASFN